MPGTACATAPPIRAAFCCKFLLCSPPPQTTCQRLLLTLPAFCLRLGHGNSAGRTTACFLPAPPALGRISYLYNARLFTLLPLSIYSRFQLLGTSLCHAPGFVPASASCLPATPRNTLYLPPPAPLLKTPLFSARHCLPPSLAAISHHCLGPPATALHATTSFCLYCQHCCLGSASLPVSLLHRFHYLPLLQLTPCMPGSAQYHSPLILTSLLLHITACRRLTAPGCLPLPEHHRRITWPFSPPHHHCLPRRTCSCYHRLCYLLPPVHHFTGRSPAAHPPACTSLPACACHTTWDPSASA